MNRFKLAVVWTFFALLALPLRAQTGTSTITGRVQDPTRAVIPNVTVTVIHVATNFTSVAITTNSEGLYPVPSMQPGRYRITFHSKVRTSFVERKGHQ